MKQLATISFRILSVLHPVTELVLMVYRHLAFVNIITELVVEPMGLFMRIAGGPPADRRWSAGGAPADRHNTYLELSKKQTRSC